MALKTVQVPEEMAPLFERAEKLVSEYFSRLRRDPEHGTIDIAGERYVLVRAASLSVEFFSAIERLFGPERRDEADAFAANLLFDLAHSLGRNDARRFHATMRLEDPVERLSAGPVHFSHSGWAFVDIFPESRPSPDESFFLVYDHPYSFEADAWLRAGKSTPNPVCIMNAGYSSGWCTESFGISLVATELLCRAAGDDCCRFVMAPPEQIEARVQSYLGQASSRTSAEPRRTAIPDLFARKRVEEALRRSNEALRESERKYRSLYESMSEGVALHDLILDDDGRPVDYVITDVNPAYEAITGFSRAQAVGRRATELYGKDAARLLERFAAVAQGGEPTQFETTFEPSRKTLSISVFPHGEGSFATVFEDITERRRMAEQLQQSEKMRAIGQLAGGIAHDFNNQLVGMMGFAELLRRRLGDPRLQHYADRILTACHRSKDLTAQMLAFARKGHYRSVVVSVHKLVAEVVSLLERTIDKRIAIKQYLEAVPPTTIGDPSQLQNAILNVALNARDAMPEGGTITFTTRLEEIAALQAGRGLIPVEPGTYLAVTVSDTGAGMDPETRRHVFEPFFTTKEQGQGTGMGLAAVYGTVEAHGGTIVVESEVGRGSTFRIYLPATATTEATLPAGDEPRKARRSASILVVDDEEHVRELAEEMLGELGHRVTCRADGESALAYYREAWKTVDLVVLDLVMPKLGGRETLAKLREINPDLRAILTSGYVLLGGDGAGLGEGALAFVEKPFEMDELARCVETALEA